MKKFFLVILFLTQLSLLVFAQKESVYFDNRNTEGMGLVLYSNGIFECDFRYEFLETGVDPVLFYSKGFWHPIDSCLTELKSFEEYKSKIVNVIALRNPEIKDSIVIQVYDKEGNRIGYAFLDEKYQGDSHRCSIEGVYAWDILDSSYYKTKDIIHLPYGLTYDFSNDCNQYFFIVSTYPMEGYYSYHDCVIKIDSDKKHFRIVENRESYYRSTPK